jgi:transposase
LLEERINIKFYVELGKNARDTCAMLSEAYEEEVMKKSSVFQWHKRFKEGRENVEDDERSGCPKSHRNDENVEKMRNLAHSDRRLSIRAMTVQLNFGKETAEKA